MICSSGVGFDPVVDGTHHRFDVAGLYNGLFVMEDRETGSIWTHYDGTVLRGPLAETGARMEIEPMLHLRWKDWLEQYPDSLVVAQQDGFEQYYGPYEPGQRGLSPLFQRTLLDAVDDRLAEAALVVGVDVDGQSRAYPIDELSEPTVINDDLGGQAIVVVIDPGSLFGIAYEATVDGEPRTFRWDDGLIDDQGNRWTLDGSGPAGQLTFVTSFITEWYGWAAYHPDTDIFTS